MYEGNATTSYLDEPLNATNFYGFGINSATLRYQVPATSTFHKFFCGSTQALQIGASSSTFAGTLNLQTLQEQEP